VCSYHRGGVYPLGGVNKSLDKSDVVVLGTSQQMQSIAVSVEVTGSLPQKIKSLDVIIDDRFDARANSTVTSCMYQMHALRHVLKVLSDTLPNRLPAAS